MYFYQRLRDLRTDAERTQEDIAALLGISRQHYSLYEKGERELPMHHFVTLAKYYDVSLDYLAGLLSAPEPLSRTPKTTVPPQERRAEKILSEVKKLLANYGE